MNQEILQPSPAKQAENAAHEAQELAANHAESLNSLAQGSPNRTPEDEAVLREWASEGKDLRTDAVVKSDEASLANPVQTVSVDEHSLVESPGVHEMELAHRQATGAPSDETRTSV